MQVTISKRGVAACVVCALALVSCLGAASVAFADDAAACAGDECGSACIPAALVSTDGYVTGAATRAAGPALEILGLASVEESGQFVDTTSWYSWSQPKYWLAASYCNSSLSPYLANLAYTDLNSESDADGYKAAVLNTSRAGGGNGPNASLEAYGGSDETDQAVWALDPDIIIGTGGGVDYETYGATGIEYSFSNYTTLVETMEAIAAAADSSVSSTKSLRYDSATAIAEQYEEYIFGTIGYIAEAIEDEATDKKTVALVENATYDEETKIWTYDLMTDSEASGGDGTAATNRYLETTSANGLGSALDVADNYADIKETVTATELQSNDVDLIIVGGQQSSSNYSSIANGLYEDKLLVKTYFVEDNGSNGAMYGVVMNSVENAQNIGRILGCLYDDVIDQQDWLAYYYETFYHIDSDCMVCSMNNALEGVRCWSVQELDYSSVDSATAATAALSIWSVSGTGYTSDDGASAVESKLVSGYSYYVDAVGTGSTSVE